MSGNIFCVRDDEDSWQKTDLIDTCGPINLTPTVSERINRNTKKIEKLLTGEEISGPVKEQEVLRYVSNIICIDSARMRQNHQTPVVRIVVEGNNQNILKLAEKKITQLRAPLELLESNQSIDLLVQDKAFKVLSLAADQGVPIALTNKIDYENCLVMLRALNDLYELEKFEPRLVRSKNYLKYLAVLMNNWMNGISLNQMVNKAIEYQSANTNEFYVGHRPVGRFDRFNAEHVNVLIEDIEKRLRFGLERYFGHYHLICTKILGEQKAGANWAQFLEYGTRNGIVIALQNLGLSRHTASLIYREHRDCLVIEGDKLSEILSAMLEARINKETVEFDEVKAFIF